MDEEALLRMAGAVREACVQAAQEGFEEAGMLGLCSEGALENAVAAIRAVDVAAILAEAAERGS